MIRSLALMTVLALAACSSRSVPRAADSPAATLTPAAQRAVAGATLRLTIPAPKAPSYVSPSAQSLVANSYVVSGGVVSGGIVTTTTVNLSGPACASSGAQRVCTVGVSGPIGTATFGITIYDGLNGTGNALATVSPSVANASTIAADGNSTLTPLVLGGVPVSATVAVTGGSFVTGTAGTATVIATVRDAGGNVIVGSAPYANPVTFTAADPAITFSGAQTSPGSGVTLSYSGAPLAGSSSASVAVSAYAAAPFSSSAATVLVTPGALTESCAGCNGLSNGPSPFALSVSQAGNAGGTITANAGSGTGCTVDPTSTTMGAGSVTFNVYGNPAGGSCSITFTDTYGNSVASAPSFIAAGAATVISATPSVTPADPNCLCGFLYIYAGGTAVRYGSYTAVPFMSNQNPGSFELATYANLAKARVKQQTISGNRYITSTAISAPYAVFTGQSGGSNVGLSTLVP